MLTRFFGLATCVAYDAPWWVFVIGFLCLLMD
jgi:hypothetical protein